MEETQVTPEPTPSPTPVPEKLQKMWDDMLNEQ
jgi:hypothetical protein